MATTPNEAVSEVQTGVKDVLKGYDTLLERAEPEITPIVRDLKTMHERHAEELERHHSRLASSSNGEGSVRGAINEAAVTLRDWVSTLDENALSFVRDGEERLMKIYDGALSDWSANDNSEISELLTAQWNEIRNHVAGLPKT